MNREIIKISNLKIYIILIFLTTHKNIQKIYYILFIYLITFIEKNYLRKYETQRKKIKIERDKTDS